MKLSKSNSKKQRFSWRKSIAIVGALCMVLFVSTAATAAQVTRGNPYILPRGEVVNDDLYVTGGEIIIDGAVEGDVVVAGGYVEINGVINGDLLAVGGAVVIAGTVQDDVRVAGGAVVLNGSVGDDFIAAAGGGWPGMIPAVPMPPIRLGNHSVPQGLLISPGATIGGDAYIGGGQGTVAGSIGQDLVAGMGTLTFAGHVAGDANLNAKSLQIDDQAEVQGKLTYSTSGNTTIPPDVSSSVEAQPWSEAPNAPQRNPIAGFFGWLLRTALILIGYLLVAWLIWAFAPHQLSGTDQVMQTRPMEAGVIGLLAAVAVIPLGAALSLLGALFWGWFPGGFFVATFVFGFAALLWLLSPVFTGLWVGGIIGRVSGSLDSDLARLLVGTAVIVLVCRLLTVIPCLGALLFQMIFLVSFALTIGSWLLGRRRPPQEAALLPASITPAAQT